MILLSHLISEFADALRVRFAPRLLPGHERALTAMQQCRTEHSPVLVVSCPQCGHRETLPHSCGHRSCPHCQHHEGQQWLERQRAKLLPVDYFMITFTLPFQLRALAWQHQRLVYDLLLKLGWQTLSQFGLNDSKLQGKMGAHAVLHTHSRHLDFHPHVHFIVPAGALDTKHRLWRRKNGTWLFHEGNLARVFRAKWFQALKDEGLKVASTVPKDWVVDCKHVGRGDKALTYLGKYLYRGVLQEKDILRCEQGQVTFRYTENTGTVKTRTLPGEEFLWLLLQHVLPKGFRRTRDYGFLHSNSKPLIQLLQYLFHTIVRRPPEKRERPSIPCKVCGGIMQIIATGIRRWSQAEPSLQPI
jgi:hypothetical protein